MAFEVRARDGMNGEEMEVNGNAQGQASRETTREQDTSTSPIGEKPQDEEKTKTKPPSKLKTAWSSLGLDVPTALMMGKAALPPTIAIAMFQADKVAQFYTTLGYLVAISSIIGFCIMPRAKFVQTMLLNITGLCIGSALSLLMTWSGVKARQNTTDPTAPPQRYNSSQSAVLGVWLFFQTWAINTTKAKFPQLAFPTILYAIQINVAATTSFYFSTTLQCETLVRKLLITFLTGFALATGVSLFVLPTSCRTVVKKEMTGFITILRGALGAHKAYIHSLEDTDVFNQTYMPEDENEDTNKKDKKPKAKARPEVTAIQKMTGALQELHGKLAIDIQFAKREFAYGKLTPEEFQSIFKHLKLISLPVLGLSSVMDLFERAAEINHWDGDVSEADEKLHQKYVQEWNEMFRFIHEPLDHIFQALDDGLAHSLLKLQFVKPPKKKKGKDQTDAEAKGDMVKPGDDNFAEYLKQQAAVFLGIKEPTLRHWAENKGIKLRDDYFTAPDALDDDETLKRLPSITTRKRDQRQLYTVLYVMFLLNSISRAIIDLVEFADEHDQAAAKSKIITPGPRRLAKWIKCVFKKQDSSNGDETTNVGVDSNNTVVYMGEAWNSRKDPEHLPPTNAWERFGNGVRGVSHFLRSSESVFGFRAACATMTVGVVAFLHDSQDFFVENRLVWAMIMIAISMTPTAGQTLFQFILRIGGTVVAMIFAWLVWYIPNENTAGILVLLYFFVALGFYIVIKRPQFVIAGIISSISTILIVGYELQVRKIGVQAATATTNQPAYPIYLLGPYRVAAVAGGLAVAFIWTVFPYPITEHSALRQKLGGALYLSANYYSIMHEQVLSRIRGNAGDEENDKKSAGYALRKARDKVFAKQMLALQGLKQHSGFVRWEFPLGGKFPIEEYEAIIGYVNNIVNYTSLLGYASQSFKEDVPSPTPSHTTPPPASPEWTTSFRHLLTPANITSHEITSLLALLSSSIQNAQPLPPYLHLPQAYQLSKKLEAVDTDILSIRHIAEPGYAAFAVMAVSTRCVHMDVERLFRTVRKLVGELDFSFHVVSTDSSASSSASSVETLVKGRREGEGAVKRD
ncbi:hypothetical protein P153DRAFT_346161 [Dothidotthia symphoricarpi CBS 119687]|uniref:ER transporter 6TM N-terminal domain-containing protein n=1 Tax=Dothidotthia symphoricarpi CBS 119687 TaxID=1392245 RepID=A0A6A6A693_9PLEO|nr:uncharacterized protein P153DRAFT_346161 [Dothidotthia symphoricarpi CBS 119687]KAF2126437.1 hypothetical protein P153DRAFT_346161 [Dothidotthia symphoricarpi CBS 119687]